MKIIIGKKVKCIRGHKERKNQKDIVPKYILFDDGETYIDLQEQDPHTFHDCSMIAREIIVYQNKKMWDWVMKYDKYGDANIDL